MLRGRTFGTGRTDTDAVWNECPTNFSLSPGFDKLKLVGHQTASLPGERDYNVCLKLRELERGREQG
jgi:hypothetical protein